MNEAPGSADASAHDRVAHTATLLDVECLDQTLFRMIENALLSLFRDAPSSATSYAKLLALPLIRFITILATNGHTPATQILKLDLSSGDVRSHSTRVAFFASISSIPLAMSDPLAEWIKTAIQKRFVEQQREGTDLARIAQERQQAVFTFIRKTVTRMFPIARLCCLLACWAGITRTPSLAMLVSGLGFQPKGQEKPRLHVDYAHRRWIQYEAASTAKIFLAGLWMISTWKPVIDYFLLKPLTALAPRINGPQRATLTTCPICKSEIHVPVLLSCRHRCCYTCFYAELDHQNRMSCRICRKRTHESQVVLTASS